MAAEDSTVSRRTVDSDVHTHNGRTMVQDKLSRFGVSLSRALLKELDRMVREKGLSKPLTGAQ